jgi:hypothetical protein
MFVPIDARRSLPIRCMRKSLRNGCLGLAHAECKMTALVNLCEITHGGRQFGSSRQSLKRKRRESPNASTYGFRPF